MNSSIINSDGSVNQKIFEIEGLKLEFVATEEGISYKAIDAIDTILNHKTGKKTKWHRLKLKQFYDSRYISKTT